jgi:nucleotide-binding universal stress UspA family protein
VFGEARTTREAIAEWDRMPAPASRLRSLVVPVDGDSFGEHALPLALEIAGRSGADIRLMHVYRPLQSTFQPIRHSYHGSLDAYLKHRQRAYLQDLVQRLAKFTSVRVTSVFLQWPDVVDSLCEAARPGSDLIVMATRRRGPLGRLWLRSVADEVVDRVPVPVLLVRGEDAPIDLTRKTPLQHILIPLDGSESAERILEPAFALGTLAGADCTLLRVIASAPRSASRDIGPRWQRLLVQKEKKEAWRYLRRIAGPAEERKHRLRRVVLDPKSIDQAILNYAKTDNADVIALTKPPRQGIAQMFRSSAVDKVVRGTTVPVLLVGSNVK